MHAIAAGLVRPDLVLGVGIRVLVPLLALDLCLRWYIRDARLVRWMACRFVAVLSWSRGMRQSPGGGNSCSRRTALLAARLWVSGFASQRIWQKARRIFGFQSFFCCGIYVLPGATMTAAPKPKGEGAPETAGTGAVAAQRERGRENKGGQITDSAKSVANRRSAPGHFEPVKRL